MELWISLIILEVWRKNPKIQSIKFLRLDMVERTPIYLKKESNEFYWILYILWIFNKID
jgi:hypothetical protein